MTDYTTETTEWLVERLEEDGLDLDLAIPNELAKRPECVPLLKRSIQYYQDDGDGWALLHAIHLLGMIKTNESLDALIYALVNRHETLGDWLTEDMPGLLAGMGPNALPSLEEVANMKILDTWARTAAISAIAAIGWRHPEEKQHVISILTKIVEGNDEDTIIANTVCDLADLHEPSTIPTIQKAFRDNKVDLEVVDEPSALEMASGNSHDHESHEETFKRCADYFTDYLQKISEPAQESKKQFMGKIGRNEACPCGSGKKYKKCCLKT